MVNYFINVFGLECNIGTVPAESSLEIAWATVEDNKWEIDLVICVSFPVTDPYFADWFSKFLQTSSCWPVYFFGRMYEGFWRQRWLLLLCLILSALTRQNSKISTVYTDTDTYKAEQISAFLKQEKTKEC